MAKEKKYKLDLFRLLDALDRRDFKFYSNLTEEEKKGFAGIVAMRWMSVVSDSHREACEYFIQAVNDTANIHFWNSEMQKHPELQYLSLAVSGFGVKQRHKWIKGPSKKQDNKVRDMLRQYYPTANREELDFILKNNELEDLIEMAKILGYQDDKIKELSIEIRRLKK